MLRLGTRYVKILFLPEWLLGRLIKTQEEQENDMRTISYCGKKVSIGIDVHLSTYYVTCVHEGSVVKRASMKAEPDEVVKFLRNHFAGAELSTAYEAGFSGFELHRRLEKEGIRSLVINAASLEVAARERVKNDKRDSQKLALQLDGGRLKGIRIPSLKEEAARVLHRTREQLVRDRAALKVQIRMKFYQFGLRVTQAKEELTFVRVEKGLRENLPEEVKTGIRALVAIWQALNVQIREIEGKQREQAKSDERDRVFRSLPGYGFQTARILSTELGDMSQFPNERALFSFLGLTPSEWTSGDDERKGPISKQGSGRLRAILVEAAWTAVRKDPELKRTYETLARRTGKKRAIVAIARRLIGRARALLRKGEIYKSQRALKRAA